METCYPEEEPEVINEEAAEDEAGKAVSEEPADAEPSEGEGTPTEGEDASSEGEETPTEGEDASSEGEETPTEGEDASSEGEETPTEGEETSSEGEGTPTEGEDASSEGEETPTEGEDALPEGEETPTEDGGVEDTTEASAGEADELLYGKAYVYEVTTEIINGETFEAETEDTAAEETESTVTEETEETATEEAEAAEAEIPGLEFFDAASGETPVTVSSHSNITYRINADIKTFEEDVTYKTDMLYFSVKLPYSEEYVCFDTEKLNHFVLWNIETDEADGSQTLSGCYEVKPGTEGADPIPGIVSFDIPVKVLALPGDTVILPTGQCWLEGNPEEYIREIGFQTAVVEAVMIQSAEIEDTWDRSGDAATTGDSYVQEVTATLGYSGTKPFDADNNPGNDMDTTNNIVRSFDKVSYTLNVAMNSREQNEEVSSGTICFSVELPYSDYEATFDEASIATALGTEKYTITKEANKQILTGEKTVNASDGVNPIPGNQTLEIPVNVRAMKNGDKLKLTGQFWMADNPDSEKKSVVFPELTVSARMQLNVQLIRSTKDSTNLTGTYDFGLGSDGYINSEYGKVYGKSLVYGVTLQLEQSDTAKGMRGQELPDPNGTIKLSLNLSGTYTPEGGSTYGADSEEMAPFQPLVYSVEGNNGIDLTFQDDGRNLVTVEGYTPGQHLAYNAAPTNIWTVNSGNKKVACEDGGTWSVVSGSTSTVNIEVSGYKITTDSKPTNYVGTTIISDFVFPRANYGLDGSSSEYYYYMYYNPVDASLENISTASFSAGEVWVIIPYAYTDSAGEAHRLHDVLGNGSYNITVEDVFTEATSVSNTVLTSQADTTDDINTYNLALTLGEGTYEQTVWYTTGEGGWKDAMGTGEAVEKGTDYTVLGDTELAVYSGYAYKAADTDPAHMAASNLLLKFDGSVLELDESRNPSGISTSGPTELSASEMTVYYGYLASGGNWSSDTEMLSAQEDDLVWSSTYDSDRTCVAVLLERRGIVETGTVWRIYHNIKFKVKSDPNLLKEDINDNVHMICQNTRMWTIRDLGIATTDEAALTTIKAAVPSVSGGSSIEYPYASFEEIHDDYVKAVYDENGYKTGHNYNNSVGDSLLLLSYVSKIDKVVAQKVINEGTTKPKENFNFDEGQRMADYELNASLSYGLNTEITSAYNRTTVTIVDTLPAGMAYVTDSAYWNGTYEQSEGSTFGGTVVGGERFIETADLEAAGTYAVHVQENADGTTTLTFQIKDVLAVSGEIGKIYYSTRLGDSIDPDADLEHASQLVNTATIQTTEDCHRPLTEANGNKTQETITITKLAADSFNKIVLKRLNELNEDLTWRIFFNNKDAATQMNVVVVDTMPKDGDSASSEYDGSYTIAKWQLNMDKLPADVNLSDIKLYYTTDPDYLNLRLNEKDENGDPIINDKVIEESWTPVKINADGTADFVGGTNFVVAWVITGNLPGNSSFEVDVTIHQDNPQGGDILYNTASTSEFARSVPAYRVQRKVSGTVWWDMDYDGAMEIEAQGGYEQVIAGVEVILQKLNEETGVWETAHSLLEDENGNTECVTTTDANGYYLFDNLPAGDYRLMFNSDELDNELVFLTDKEAAGVANSVNSKAEAAGVEDAQAKITDVHFRIAEDMTQWTDYLQYQNAGFSVVSYELPETGGPGTWWIALTGMTLLVSSASYLLYRRKKNIA